MYNAGMKPDEHQFLLALDEASAGGRHVYVYTFAQGLGLHLKRAVSLCEKWMEKGWYDYGTSILGGWLTPLGHLAARRLREQGPENFRLEEKDYLIRLTRAGEVLECEAYTDYPDEIGFDVDENLLVTCFAISEQDAIRIAQERRDQLLAAGTWGEESRVKRP
jgi:hypothetical protein